MAALPYMPLFVADYLADTADLSTAQHGAYMLLIMNYWQRGGPLPNDNARLAKITGLSTRNWLQMRSRIEEFFESGTEFWNHARIDRELSRVADKSLKSKKAAQASVERRFGERSADGEADVEPTEADTDKEVPEDKSSGGELQILDAEAVMWRHGRLYLQSQGIAATRIGTLLGQWKRDHGAEATILALGKAQREGAIDCVSFIKKCLNSNGRKNDYDPERITV